MEVSVNNVNDNPLALVTQGFLKIDTPYFRICRCNIIPSFSDCREEIEDEPHALWRVIRGDEFKDRHLTEFETFENLACQEHPVSLHQQLTYLNFRTMVLNDFSEGIVFALILEAVGSEEPNLYERVGLAALKHRLIPVEGDHVWRNGVKQPTLPPKVWPRKTVTII